MSRFIDLPELQKILGVEMIDAEEMSKATSTIDATVMLTKSGKQGKITFGLLAGLGLTSLRTISLEIDSISLVGLQPFTPTLSHLCLSNRLWKP